jgi:hypothetical protein
MKMRNIVIFVALALLPMGVCAQDGYKKFAVDGKTWTIFHYPEAKEYQYTYQMLLKGDTVINNISYKKLYRHDNTGISYVGGFREEGEKVYYKRKDRNEVCLYNFGLSVGESFDELQNDVMGKFVVTSKGYQEYPEQKLMTLKLKYENDRECVSQWVEGVGNLSNPECNITSVGNYDYLQDCSVGGDTIYNNKAISALADVVPVKNDGKVKNSAVYDISGRKLPSIPAKGLYIKNSKKFIAK